MPKQVKLTALGKYLRKLRIDNNMSAKNMAKVLGMSTQMLYKIETGERAVPNNFLYNFVWYVYSDVKECYKDEFMDAYFATVNDVNVTVNNTDIAFNLYFADDEQIKEIRRILARSIN
jgi:HTH-type transcriptional regulator, competence development regulator